ncbi:bifunctional (p)ppGpp synthetase/guanosine-3',5'-bis(diphosphate) 3'-pyrophosphohydrolase [Patescibacteria group bacterium]|nr:bifunctional (p)ppGpp synthetase/guanosine-3',5'-bis(diphosphate) 3'-pyrophosphohydrolase [Patescibacteria group bacterium]
MNSTTKNHWSGMPRTSVPREIKTARLGLFKVLPDRLSAADKRLLEGAIALAEKGHEGQRRGTGEPYLCHPLAVATILAEWKLDTPTIVAALLHDLPEDTAITLEEIKSTFNPEIAGLVESVTKLSAVRIPQEDITYEVENLRRLFLAMAQDIRVVLLKLADRLHNARTINGMAAAKRARYGREILEIYAPLADRLGMGEVRFELSEIGFQHADPKAHDWTRTQAQAGLKRSEQYLNRVKHDFVKAIAEENITATIDARAKNTYSLYRKLVEKQRDINQIYDLLAIRIIVDTVEDCYQCMGIIHRQWQPLPHRIKDYIAVPKLNGYRSLHTTVFGPDNKLLEVQFRTWQMHEEAELGVAAHSMYEQSKKSAIASPEHMAVMKQLKSWQDEMQESADIMQRFKLDLFSDRIFVFTPKGALYSLPAGSTSIDFAYAVHTEVGNRCRGAKVNGVIVPLDEALHNGAVVEIMTRTDATPKQDWLNSARTGHARSSIKRYLRDQTSGHAVSTGRTALNKALQAHKTTLSKVPAAKINELIGETHGARDLDSVLRRIGEGTLTIQTAVKRLGFASKPMVRGKRTARRRPEAKRAYVDGEPALATKLAACCKPKPGDRIVGYVTVGRVITVHAEGCTHLKRSADPSRLVSVAWA